MDFSRNYFEVFGLTVTFDIDPKILADRYLALQKQVHPDHFAGGTEQEKRLSMQWATRVNTAHTTLRDPLQRAGYLLELRGITLAGNPVLAPEFLLEQIELREQLEDIEASIEVPGNSAACHQAQIGHLATFKQKVDSVMTSLQIEFASAIDKDLPTAEQVVYKMQFMHRLLVAADHVEEKLLDY